MIERALKFRKAFWEKHGLPVRFILLLGVFIFTCLILFNINFFELGEKFKSEKRFKNKIKFEEGRFQAGSSYLLGSHNSSKMSSYFMYQPQEDITPYEISLIIPLFSDLAYGKGELSTGCGAMIPVRDKIRGGWPADASIPVVTLSSHHVKRLGPAIRHFINIETSATE